MCVYEVKNDSVWPLIGFDLRHFDKNKSGIASDIIYLMSHLENIRSRQDSNLRGQSPMDF